MDGSGGTRVDKGGMDLQMKQPPNLHATFLCKNNNTIQNTQMNTSDMRDKGAQNKEQAVVARPTVVIEIPNTTSPQDDFYLFKQVSVEISKSSGDDHDTATISLPPPQSQSHASGAGADNTADSFLANIRAIMDIETPVTGGGRVGMHSPNKRTDYLKDRKVVVLTRRGENLIRLCFVMACMPIIAAIVAILYVVITRVRKV